MDKIEELLLEIENPQVYSGLELNRSKKKFSKKNINICLVFPDKYEIGMSHQGIKILYRLLDGYDDVNVERAFLPGRESIKLFREKGVDLFSLENRQSLKKFDLIGFSILSELSYTNILLVLDLASIPLRSDERDGSHPLIAVGGISGAANPEPIREFVDMFAIGDGEVIFPGIIDVLRSKSRERKRVIDEMNGVEGLYVPSKHTLKKEGLFFTPDLAEGSVRKSVISGLNNVFKGGGVIVPVTEVVFNRLETEIARGCPQNCRFCQARVYYSPYRIRKGTEIIKEQSDQLKLTGFESISFSSLSSGDHPQIESLIKSRSPKGENCVSLSLPSLRPSTLSGSILKEISKSRKTGITIVPEAGSDRLRKIINKETEEGEIIDAVENLLKSGWQKIKIYFMLGLPFEESSDIEELAVLVEKMVALSKKRGKNLRLHISFSPFVPKPHTPFQWAAREKQISLKEKRLILKERLKKYKNVKLDFHRIDKGVVETILSRGDVRVGKLILDAFLEGEIFSAWDSDFNFDVWESLILKHGLKIFLERIPVEENLPWDFIDLGLKKDHLLKEYSKAGKGSTTPSCLEMSCHECDGCNFKFSKNRDKFKKDSVSLNDYNSAIGYKRVLLFYRKTEQFIYLSHLTMMKYIERMIRRTGVHFRCTEGFHPRIKMSSPAPLPILASGDNEVVEIFIDESVDKKKFLSSLRSDPVNLEILNVEEKKSDSVKLSRSIEFAVYEFSKSINAELRAEILNAAGEFDTIKFGDEISVFKIHYPRNGIERFGKIFRIIDPDRKKRPFLRRKYFVFKDKKN